MHYRITHTTQYAYTDPVAVCHNLVRLAPRDNRRQRCGAHRLIVVPEPVDSVVRIDPFGNEVGYFSIEQAHHRLSLQATSEVWLNEQPEPRPGPPWETVRDALAMARDRSGPPPQQFVFASPMIPGAKPPLAAYARESFTEGRPIVDALRELTSRIYQDFDYDPRATTVSTPIDRAFELRAGVCQDFAHVAIGCLRSLGLAARYVSGYLRTQPPPGRPRLVGADASHAWVSLYCGGAELQGERNAETTATGWVDADPTNDRLIGSDHVTLAHGRDYSDVCPVQGVYVGGGGHTMTVSVDVAPLD